MSATEQPLSIKELKEIFEMIPKAQLVSILVGKTLLIRELIEKEEKPKS